MPVAAVMAHLGQRGEAQHCAAGRGCHKGAQIAAVGQAQIVAVRPVECGAGGDLMRGGLPACAGRQAPTAATSSVTGDTSVSSPSPSNQKSLSERWPGLKLGR